MAQDQKARMRGEKDRFFSSIEDFGYCETATVRTVLLKTNLGEWFCIGIFGVFQPGVRPSLRRVIFESEHVLMEERVLEAEALKEFIESLITKGAIESEYGTVVYGGSKSGLTDLTLFSTVFRIITTQEGGFASIFLYGFAQEEGSLYDPLRISSELLAGEEPYNSLEDLVLDKTGEHLSSPFPLSENLFQSYASTWIGGGYLRPTPPATALKNTSVIVRAPVLMNIGAQVKEREVEVTLRSHEKTDLSRFRLSVIVRGQAEHPALKRTSLPLTNQQQSGDGFSTVTHRLEVTDARSAQVMLFRRRDNSLLDFRDFFASNTLKSVIHRHLDPEYGVLEAWLRGSGKDRSDDFEWGVSLLLSVLGFATEWVGSDFETATMPLTRKHSGVDVVAHSPDESAVIVCQCTTKEPSEKINQLNVTVNEIKKKVGSREANVIPAVFTTIDENNMEQEIERSRNDGIAIVGARGIETLLNHLRRGTSPKDVVDQVFRPLVQKPFPVASLLPQWVCARTLGSACNEQFL